MSHELTSPVTVMVVDDESYIVEMLTAYLEDHGYDVEGYTNPLEALDRYRQKTFDLIVTDLKMDEMSGTELVDQIRKKDADTLIIIMTGFASIQSAIRAIQQEVYDYLQKPFKLAEINAVIGRAAEKLLLQRENDALHRRIDKMLADITLLYDVSNILYQVPTFETAMDMVLDTLSEGIKVTSAAIFKYETATKRYDMTHARGIWESLGEGFGFTAESTICNQQISPAQATVVSNPPDGWRLNDQTLRTDGELEQCILIPIQYQNSTVGFLGICNGGHPIYEKDDAVKLYSVLATQIAPLFHETYSHGSAHELSAAEITEPGHLVVQDAIQNLGPHDTQSFFLMKLMPHSQNAGEDEINLEIHGERLFEPIRDIFTGEGITMRQYFDTLFVGVRNWDTVSLELAQEKARSRLEAELNDNPPASDYSVVLATVNYPRDGRDGAGLYRLLVKRILNANNRLLID
ncbi:MAG: response regulator [Candidatus Marinimicrobia bacterium]|nr:response regulator [Candidatus Neomarinimicrobiota bacterium]MCF7841071.1 response regulator [Candidatus Neomarinimicrobiota bacterium]MCF7902292.1 response regulator [Candidatus Neomarinimicrobiota bacterium]